MHTIENWYVRQAGRLLGPYNSTQVRQLVLQGELTLNDEVSSDRQAWRPLLSEPAVVPHQIRHDAQEDERDLQREHLTHRRQAMASLLLTLLLLSAAFGLALWQDRPMRQVVDCAAAPLPGVNWQDCRFDALSAPQANLRQVILTNGALPGARLQGADLSEGDLRYTGLQGADLSYARLSGARLKGADLRGADLTYAQLSGADLSYADLRGARLGGADLGNAQLHGALWIDGRRCEGERPGSCGAAVDP